MLSNDDASHKNLKRIADALRISVSDFDVSSDYCKKQKQTERMLTLWEKLLTDRLREDALGAVSRIIQNRT